MPQMAPLNWILLFIMFIAAYLIFNMMNYFIYTPEIKKTKKSSLKKFNLNWKW